jgi:hypothetical protein
MAGTLICRNERPEDRDRTLDIMEAVYKKRPDSILFPPDCYVVEEDGRIVAFAALYRLEDVVIGALDWASIEVGRTPEDISDILASLLDRLREVKIEYGLRAIMIHTPYDEIRQHLSAADLQTGEEKVRRLVVTNQTGSKIAAE